MDWRMALGSSLSKSGIQRPIVWEPLTDTALAAMVSCIKATIRLIVPRQRCAYVTISAQGIFS